MVISKCWISLWVPSHQQLLRLGLFKTYGRTPHTLESCVIELREISDFMEHFAANVVVDRVETVIRKRKYHASVNGPPLLFLSLPFCVLFQQCCRSLWAFFWSRSRWSCMRPEHWTVITPMILAKEVERIWRLGAIY